MTGPVFVDTNVLVYARDASERDKQKRANAWLVYLWRSRAGRLSMQVLYEFYVTVTEKLRSGIDRKAARRDVRNLMAWHPARLDRTVLEGAWAVQDRYKQSWWDALIISAAQVSRSRTLLTEDLQEGQRFGEVEVVNPCAREPGLADSLTDCQSRC
jgi:predicted nucleic acid-binding protein